MNSLLLRNTRNATSAISQCVSALSRELKGENASLASAAAAFNLLQMKGIASRSSLGSVVGNSSASTTRPASNQADIDGNASGAVADVTGVVNQLDEKLRSYFGSRLPAGPSGSSGAGDGGSSGFAPSSSSPTQPPPPPHPLPPPRRLRRSARASSSSSSSSPNPSPGSLTHVDSRTGAASMVDVGLKRETRRVAVARGRVLLWSDAAFAAVEANAVAKGDVLSLARVAGILGAKAVANLIPLCHTIILDQVKVSASLDKARRSVELEAEVSATGKTGVEMEALAAVTAAALTVYDMTKALSKGSVIKDVRLVSKKGGKSGDWRREEEERSWKGKEE